MVHSKCGRVWLGADIILKVGKGLEREKIGARNATRNVAAKTAKGFTVSKTCGER